MAMRSVIYINIVYRGCQGDDPTNTCHS